MNEIAFPCGHTVAHEEECPRCDNDTLRQQLAQACKERNEAKAQYSRHAIRVTQEQLAAARAELAEWQRMRNESMALACKLSDALKATQAELTACRGDMDIQSAELARTEQQLADCREASEAMRAALEKYGTHERGTCVKDIMGYPYECSCGLNAALALKPSRFHDEPSDAKDGT